MGWSKDLFMDCTLSLYEGDKAYLTENDIIKTEKNCQLPHCYDPICLHRQSQYR